MSSQVADPEIFRRLDEVTKLYGETNNKLVELTKILDTRRVDLEGAIKDKTEALKWSSFQPQYLRDFIEEPYVVEPFRIGKAGKVLEWRIYVPKFVRFSAGRLERVTSSYNVFSITQYHRFFGDVPEELKDRFPELPYDVKVHDGLLVVPAEFQEEAWSRFKEHLQGRTGTPGIIRIKPKDEWSLIAQIIEEGRLPFEPKPVDPVDLRPRSVEGFALQEGWEERDYQLDADRVFMEYGAIGVYWPFGTGKSQWATDWLDRLKGHKVIIAGKDSTLREQWVDRLLKMPPDRRSECHVFILQNREKIEELVKRLRKEGKQITLIIFDECHHLPAPTFMWLSTIDAKYRIGLTGSPYREDGHIEYIMALTGMPHGFAWTRFVTSGVISLAQVQVHVVKEWRQKLAILDDLLKRDLGKTMIFCDSLDLGDKIAKKYGLEWVHGETKSRLEIIRRNEVVVVSRVADEGISVSELDTLIEIDFMGGSRAQEMQRAGRLSHRAIQPDKEPAVHHVLMTEEEVDKYGKRLLSFYDKGFKVDMLYGI